MNSPQLLEYKEIKRAYKFAIRIYEGTDKVVVKLFGPKSVETTYLIESQVDYWELIEILDNEKALVDTHVDRDLLVALAIGRCTNKMIALRERFS